MFEVQYLITTNTNNQNTRVLLEYKILNRTSGWYFVVFTTQFFLGHEVPGPE